MFYFQKSHYTLPFQVLTTACQDGSFHNEPIKCHFSEAYYCTQQPHQYIIQVFTTYLVHHHCLRTCQQQTFQHFFGPLPIFTTAMFHYQAALGN